MILKRLRMTATQTVDGQTDANTFETTAKWEFSPDAVTVTYDEQGDMRGTTTTVTVAGETVTIARRGMTASQMVFEPKKRHAFDYETAAGLFKLSTVTETVAPAWDEHGGTLTLRYRLYTDGLLLSKNEIVMEIHEKSEEFNNG